MKPCAKPSWKYPGKWIIFGYDGRPLGLYDTQQMAERALEQKLSPRGKISRVAQRQLDQGANFKTWHSRAVKRGSISRGKNR